MKKRTPILPVLIAAAITFAGLFALAGPKNFNRYHHHRHCQHQPFNNNTDSAATKKETIIQQQ